MFDIVYSLIENFIDRETGYSEDSKVTTFPTKHLNLANPFVFKLCGVIGSRMVSHNLKNDFRKLKAVSKEMLAV